MQLSCLPQGCGDVIHGFIEGQVRICEHRAKEAGEGSRQLESTQPKSTSGCPRTTKRLNTSSGDRQGMKLSIYQDPLTIIIEPAA